MKERLIKKAKTSICHYKISAIALNKKGDVLGYSMNKPRFTRYGGGKHAEMELIHRYSERIKTIVICRIGKKGILLPIVPCKKCRKIADKLGIVIRGVS
jgi:cytidine deaminase